MKVGLLITFYKRPDLALQCVESLMSCDLSKLTFIYMHDDASNSESLSHTMHNFSLYLSDNNIPSIIHQSTFNKGIKTALNRGCNYLFYLEKCDHVINLDADSVLKKGAINALVNLKALFPDRIVSGFNCNHPKNPILIEGDTYVERKMANGINMMFSQDQYENIILPGLNSQNNWDAASSHDKNFIITKPSVVDHLGWNQSTMGHGLSGDGDRAYDF